MVKRPKQRQRRGRWPGGTPPCRAEQTADGLRAGERAQAMLMGHAQWGAKCCAGTRPTRRHAPHSECTDPAVSPAQRDEPRDTKTSKHGRKHFCIR